MFRLSVKMGGSGSTRRVTVREDESTGMVKVSESVVNRLIGKEERFPAKRHQAQEGTLDFYQKQQEDEDLRQMKRYYEEKVKALEARNSELFDQQKDQFAMAVQEVESKFLKTTASPICQDLQNAVLECYHANRDQSLVCSPQVKAFNECVQQQREKILSKRG